MSRCRNFSCSISCCLALLVVSLLLGGVTTLLFFLGLLGNVAAAVPFLIAIVLVGLAIFVALLIATAFIDGDDLDCSQSGFVMCVCQNGLCMLASIVAALIALIFALIVTVADLLTILVLFFLAATAVWFFALNLINLIKCIICAVCSRR